MPNSARGVTRFRRQMSYPFNIFPVLTLLPEQPRSQPGGSMVKLNAYT
jgi:hypothetical protein